MAEGTLLLSNQTVQLGAAGTPTARATLDFPVPPGGNAGIHSATFKMDLPDEHEIDVENVQLTRPGGSEDISISRGNINLAEYAGTGRFPRVWPTNEIGRAVEIGDQNSLLRVTLNNRDASTPHRLTLGHTFEVRQERFGMSERRPDEDPQLFFFNQTIILQPQQEDRFVFTAPKGRDALIKEFTHFVNAGSDEIIIKKIDLTRAGDSESIDVLDNDMNIEQMSGDGEVSRLLEVIERLREQDDLVVRIRNDEPTIPVRVSLTTWMVTMQALGDGR